MSGIAEGSTVLGLISAIISIIDASKKVYDAAHDAKGLPEAFREAARHLPLAENTLRSAYAHAQQNNAVEDQAAAKAVVQSCKEKATHLKRIFKAVLPEEDAGRLERYYKAARTLGKGGRVEDLMKGILADVQSLTNNHAIRGPTEQQLEEVKKALMELAAIKEPSIPDEELEEKSSNTHYGTGDIMSHSGSGSLNKFADQSKQFNATTMNFNIHITQVLARSTQRICMNSSTVFTSLVKGLTSFRSLLEITEDLLEDLGSRHRHEQQVQIVIKECNECMEDVQLYVEQHEDFPTTHPDYVVTDIDAAEVKGLEQQIAHSITMLGTLNSLLGHASQSAMKKMLRKYIEDIRNGKRESVVSRYSIDSINTIQRIEWREVRKGLQEMGLTPVSFALHRTLISKALQDAVLPTTSEESLEPTQILDGIEDTGASSPLLPEHGELSEPDKQIVPTQSMTGDSESSSARSATADPLTSPVYSANSPYRSPTRSSPGAPSMYQQRQRHPGGSDASRQYVRSPPPPMSPPAQQHIMSIPPPSPRNVTQQSHQHPGVMISLPPGPPPVSSWQGSWGRSYDARGFPLPLPNPPTSTQYQANEARFGPPTTADDSPEVKSKYSAGFETQLLDAVRQDVINDVTYYIRAGMNIETTDKDGSTLLLIACSLGHHRIFDFLVRNNANINATNKAGQTPLMVSTVKGYKAFVEDLLERGADVNAQDNKERSTLLASVATNSEEMVRLLLNAGADTEASGFHQPTPLLQAVMVGNLEIVNLLLERGADCEQTKVLGIPYCTYGPLTQAIITRQHHIAGALLKGGANPNCILNGETVLKSAFRSYNPNGAVMLLNFGADLTKANLSWKDFKVVNAQGQTALLVALESSSFNIAKLLLRCGSDYEAADHLGKTALMYAADSVHQSFSLVALLAEFGADINEADENGRTLLMKSIENGDSALAGKLLELGADVNAVTRNGETALTMVAKSINRPKWRRIGIALLDKHLQV